MHRCCHAALLHVVAVPLHRYRPFLSCCSASSTACMNRAQMLRSAASARGSCNISNVVRTQVTLTSTVELIP
ncbi:hypothetical protein PF004_g29208 [Phytophthora fragariae]|uniref:Uncharacterized protein n=1 Tax=Phytophthora fragariae TaxID=53985 RepID=A0A6G0MFF2_9STRA|nr:hypothetical protein PF004_g29208 [Phytophthora fragariae]